MHASNFILFVYIVHTFVVGTEKLLAPRRESNPHLLLARQMLYASSYKASNVLAIRLVHIKAATYCIYCTYNVMLERRCHP